MHRRVVVAYCALANKCRVKAMELPTVIHRDFARVLPETTVGSYVTIWWSNGAGFSIYRVEETQAGPHQLVQVADYDVLCDGSGYTKVLI